MSSSHHTSDLFTILPYSCSVLSAILFHSYFDLTSFSPLLRKFFRRLESFNICRIACINESTSPGATRMPFLRSLIISDRPPVFEQITGQPSDKASKITIPNGSYKLGKT